MDCRLKYTTDIIEDIYSIAGVGRTSATPIKHNSLLLPIGGKDNDNKSLRSKNNTYFWAQTIQNKVNSKYNSDVFGNIIEIDNVSNDKGTIINITVPKKLVDAYEVKHGDKTMENFYKEHEARMLEGNQKIDDEGNIYYQTDSSVNYGLKAIDILSTDKAKQVFEKGKKNNWDLNKILTELAIPKEQKELILDIHQNILNKARVGIIGDIREEIITDLLANYSYTIEINTAKTNRIDNRNYNDPDNYDYYYETPPNERGEIIDKEISTNYYSNLTVPGGTNYTENEIATPAITPSIKGHAQFATDQGIGWFRSDDKTLPKFTPAKSINDVPNTFIGVNNWKVTKIKDGWLLQHPDVSDQIEKNSNEILEMYNYASEHGDNTKTRRILEVQSDLFQKGRGRTDLSNITKEQQDIFRRIRDEKSFEEATKYLDSIKENQFLQLLNKDNNWVTFFVKSIIQDSAKQTITEVQESDVEAKVRELEKEGLLEIDCKGKLKAEKGLQTNFTKGGKWKLIKDLKGYPTHKEGGVDLTINKSGVSIKNGNTQFTAKHGLVIPKN